MYRVAASFYPCALIHGTAVFGNPQPFARPAIAAKVGIRNVKSQKTVLSGKFAHRQARHCRLRGNGGPGRRHSPSCGNLSQQLNRPNTSLAACCPLSNSLPQGERTVRLLGLRFMQTNQLVQAVFYFSYDLKS
ncbi:hypothetical protein, partial [Neisseria gonorrhoeae]